MMSNSTMSNNSDLFVEKSLQFQSENINIETIPIPIPDTKFGILKLTAISAPMSKDINEIVFMVDRSGSMSDVCSDGRDKMQHILHTLKNMIIYFKDNRSAKIYVNIFAFDDIIEEIVERTDINEENIDLVISKINRIAPRNSTDIEKALISIKSTIDKIQLENPTHNICNIFMTDGEATAGSHDISYLSGLVDRNITNAFIGFGIEHDAVLLKSVSNGDNSSYYFIDKLENAGLVYGEILHGVLYKVLTNVSIEASNCLVYDYKNNVWCNSLKVVDIISESNKVYHVISSNPDDCSILLKAQAKENDSIMYYGFSISNENLSSDLSKYVFRQRTLQLLYKIKKFIEKKNNSRRDLSVFRGFENSTINRDSASIMEEQNILKTELKKIMDEYDINELINTRFISNNIEVINTNLKIKIKKDLEKIDSQYKIYDYISYCQYLIKGKIIILPNNINNISKILFDKFLITEINNKLKFKLYKNITDYNLWNSVFNNKLTGQISDDNILIKFNYNNQEYSLLSIKNYDSVLNSLKINDIDIYDNILIFYNNIYSEYLIFICKYDLLLININNENKGTINYNNENFEIMNNKSNYNHLLSNNNDIIIISNGKLKKIMLFCKFYHNKEGELNPIVNNYKFVNNDDYYMCINNKPICIQDNLINNILFFNKNPIIKYQLITLVYNNNIINFNNSEEIFNLYYICACSLNYKLTLECFLSLIKTISIKKLILFNKYNKGLFCYNNIFTKFSDPSLINDLLIYNNNLPYKIKLPKNYFDNIYFDDYSYINLKKKLSHEHIDQAWKFKKYKLLRYDGSYEKIIHNNDELLQIVRNYNENLTDIDFIMLCSCYRIIKQYESNEYYFNQFYYITTKDKTIFIKNAKVYLNEEKSKIMNSEINFINESFTLKINNNFKMINGNILSLNNDILNDCSSDFKFCKLNNYFINLEDKKKIEGIKQKLQLNYVSYTYYASYHPKEPGKLNFLGTPWKKGKITLNSNNIIFTPDDNSESITFNYDNNIAEETGMENFKDCSDIGSEKQAKCLIFTKEKGIKPIIRFNNREELEDFKNNRKKIIDRK